MCLGILDGQVPRLYGSTILGGATHFSRVLESKGSAF